MGFSGIRRAGNTGGGKGERARKGRGEATGEYVYTLRMDPRVAEQLRAVAVIDGQSFSDTLRAAIDKHLDLRRRDIEFQERLRASFAANRQLYESLGDLGDQ